MACASSGNTQQLQMVPLVPFLLLQDFYLSYSCQANMNASHAPGSQTWSKRQGNPDGPEGTHPTEKPPAGWNKHRTYTAAVEAIFLDCPTFPPLAKCQLPVIKERPFT